MSAVTSFYEKAMKQMRRGVEALSPRRRPPHWVTVNGRQLPPTMAGFLEKAMRNRHLTFEHLPRAEQLQISAMDLLGPLGLGSIPEVEKQVLVELNRDLLARRFIAVTLASLDDEATENLLQRLDAMASDDTQAVTAAIIDANPRAGQILVQSAHEILDELKQARRDAGGPPPKVFVSYKWQDETRNGWVRQFADDLRTKHGIDAQLDMYEVELGLSLSDYMTSRIHRECTAMLFVITPAAVEAVDEAQVGGVHFEMQLANARRLREKDFRIIGIYREGTDNVSYLSDHRYIDFREDAKYDRRLLELADSLWGRSSRPALGGLRG